MSGQLLVKYEQRVIELGMQLKYAKPGDVGLDLPVIMNNSLKIRPYMEYYINHEEKWFDIPPHGVAEVPCGLAVKIPENAWGSIKPRSSTGWKKNLMVFEGTIDSGYTGPIYVLIQNPNSTTVRVNEGDRLAQLIIIPKYSYNPGNNPIVQVDELPNTVRGGTGFGSTN